jgi:hypothetical protein
MKITIEQVSEKFNVPVSEVKQVKTKQLFIVGNSKLVSYLTVVGISKEGVWYLTKEKQSQTTTQQVNTFARDTAFTVVWVDSLECI